MNGGGGGGDALPLPPNSILAYWFPNQQGPVATMFRILSRLRQQAWNWGFGILDLWKGLLGGAGGSGGGWGGKGIGSGKGRKEDMVGRAVKVVDLLEHAVELGHMEALYKLAHVSLVGVFFISISVFLCLSASPSACYMGSLHPFDSFSFLSLLSIMYQVGSFD